MTMLNWLASRRSLLRMPRLTSTGATAPRGDIPRDEFSIRWDTCLRVDEPVRATFELGSDDGAYLLVDGRTIIDNGGSHIFLTKRGEIELVPGVHHLELRYSESNGGAGVTLRANGGLFAEDRLALPTVDPATPCDPAVGERDGSSVGPPATPGPWRAAFFDNPRLSGQPRLITLYVGIDFDWVGPVR